MRMKPLSLGDDGPDKLGSRRSLDRDEIFHGLGIGKGMTCGADPTDPFHDKSHLIVGLSLGKFLDAPVVVSDLQIDIHHHLPFHSQDKEFRLFL
jgi:hypothetical protein